MVIWNSPDATVTEAIDDFISYPPPITTHIAQSASTEQPTQLHRSTRVRTAPDRLTYPPE